MSLCHKTTSSPRLFSQVWKILKTISWHSMPIWLFSKERMLFSARCLWAHSQVQPYSGSVGFPWPHHFIWSIHQTFYRTVLHQPGEAFSIVWPFQREAEGRVSLKDYLNRFWALTVRLHTHDEVVMVTTFEQGIVTGPFSDSLIRIWRKRSLRCDSGLFLTSMRRRSWPRSTTTRSQGSQNLRRAVEPNLWGLTRSWPGREWIQGTYHMRPGGTCPRWRPKRSFGFDPSSKYPTRNCWACQESWKFWGSLRRLIGI